MECIASELAADHLASPLIGLVFKEAAAAGLDFVQLLRKHELPYSAEALSRGQPPRMPRVHAVRLYRASMQAMMDQLLRTEGRLSIRIEETDMLCRYIINSRTLAEAIHRAERFNTMLETRLVELRLHVQDDVAHFFMETFRTRKTRLTCLLDVFGLSFYHQLFGWLIGEEIAVSQVSLAYEELIPYDLVARLFDRSVNFYRPAHSISFPAALLQRAVLRNHDDLLKLQKMFPFELLPSYLTADSLTHRLHVIFRSSLIRNSAFPRLSRVATLLNQASCTVRRRLAAEGTTLKEIKRRCRQDVAMDLLSHSALSINEISDRLGFSAPSAFRRAFRAWVGMSASEYRDANGSPGSDYLSRSVTLDSVICRD
jgi:AraC-like DNA-binding protein